MDPLRPVLVAHGWNDHSCEGDFVFEYTDEAVQFSCGCQRGTYISDDFALVLVSESSHRLDVSISDEQMLSRIGLCQAAAMDELVGSSLVKLVTINWHAERKTFEFIVSSSSYGHLAFLASPYELYAVAVHVPTEFHVDLRRKVIEPLKKLLEQPADCRWADNYTSYEQLFLPEGTSLPANDNKEIEV